MSWWSQDNADDDRARSPWAGTHHESSEGRGGLYADRYKEGKSWTERQGWGARGLAPGARNSREQPRSEFRGLGDPKDRARKPFMGLGGASPWGGGPKDDKKRRFGGLGGPSPWG
jgi:hypothetical protein